MPYNDKIMEIAHKIADECQGHQYAFCSTRCPMHTDVIKYVNLIAEDKVEEALLTIREQLFLPATLGRVCPHPCEDECRRCKEYQQPISIATLKRYAADTADNENLWDLSVKPATGKKAAVIGAGPGGAQAAIDLRKEGHQVDVYEKLAVFGGMMRVGIPEYRLPRHIIDFEYSYLQKLGINFIMNTEIGKDITFEQLQADYDVVIMAHGAHKGSQIKTEGDDCTGISNAVDFLKLASLEKRTTLPLKNVLVIGGGDVAMDCARTSLRLGANKVYMVALEDKEHLPATKHEQIASAEEGIILYAGYGTKNFEQKDGALSGAKIREVISVFDKDGKFNPSYKDELTHLDIDTAIFATGQVVEDISGGKLEQKGGGRLVCDNQTMETALPGVFGAGDCAGSAIVVEAMAFGRKAAISANRYLAGQDLKADRDFAKEVGYTSNLNIPLPQDAVDLPRLHVREDAPAERIKHFNEYDHGFDKETALAEAGRCLKCECKKCMTECLMLNDFTAYPGELFKDFVASGNIEPVIPYTCNMCDQCTIVCPEEYKFSELFGEIRKEMVKANGGKSPMEGHKAINMHQLLGFSKLFSTRRKGGK